MRVFLSSRLKKRIQQDPRSLSNLAAAANLNFSQLSTLMRDQIGIGPIVRAKVVILGRLLGLSESECFREVRRG
jgi:exosome complex RNA-binding protein Csl4